MPVEIVVDRLDSETGRRLVVALGDDLDVRYGDTDPTYHDLDADQLAAPDGTFLVAWLDGVAVGCGGLRRHDEARTTAEIKRMYVDPAARGTGVGRALLAALVAAATELGYDRIVLETGTKQPEAIGLYESAGFRPTAGYGKWADGEWSRYFELPLSRC